MLMLLFLFVLIPCKCKVGGLNNTGLEADIFFFFPLLLLPFSFFSSPLDTWLNTNISSSSSSPPKVRRNEKKKKTFYSNPIFRPNAVQAARYPPDPSLRFVVVFEVQAAEVVGTKVPWKTIIAPYKKNLRKREKMLADVYKIFYISFSSLSAVCVCHIKTELTVATYRVEFAIDVIDQEWFSLIDSFVANRA